MRLDAATIQRFYRTPLGGIAAAMLSRRLKSAWPHAAGLDVLGLGYAAEALKPYRESARRVVCVAPAGQGAIAWGGLGDPPCLLSDERRLPLMDALFDRVLILHGLEEAADPQALLREVWRVMAPEGRLIVAVANRLGLWALRETTPFGHGRPYSRRQLAALLTDAMFEPQASTVALFAPPVGWGPMVRLAQGFERVGERLWPALGGVVMMEAVKRIEGRPGARLGVLVRAHAAAGAPASGRTHRTQMLQRSTNCAFMTVPLRPSPGSDQ